MSYSHEFTQRCIIGHGAGVFGAWRKQTDKLVNGRAMVHTLEIEWHWLLKVDERVFEVGDFHATKCYFFSRRGYGSNPEQKWLGRPQPMKVSVKFSRRDPMNGID